MFELKFEILNPCPVESRLWRVRVAEFNRASRKQIQNPNSQIFKPKKLQGWIVLVICIWKIRNCFGFRIHDFEFSEIIRSSTWAKMSQRGVALKLKDIGEFGFIKRIENGCLIRDTNVIRGIGDDCCVFRTSGEMAIVLTTDMLVEEIHFLLDAISPFELGRKALAVNLSDIAAMGGTPREGVISIAIPDRVDLATLDEVYHGMKSMAKEFAVNLLGGDTTSSPKHLVINIALVGEVKEDEILYRSGARAGDDFCHRPCGLFGCRSGPDPSEKR